MFRICLINMPFASLSLPSIALTQIKSRLKEQFKDRVSVEILYLNHDFGKYLGVEFYDFLSNSMQSLNGGLGDWVFRQVTFPDQPDNTTKYFERYFPGKTPEVQLLKSVVAQKRPGLSAFLDQLLTRHELDKAQVVGFTSMFMQNTASFALARKIKRRNPNIITVIGGANCEFPMGGVIARQIKSIDFVFSGPALKSFPEFIGLCLEGEKAKCSSIRGVFTNDVPFPSSGPETIGEDLSIDVPIELDYQTFVTRLGKYFPNKEVKPSLCFETSRGCWWGERAHCTFCGLNGVSMGYRAMKPQLAIDLISSLFRYSGKVTRLSAVDNILPKSYLQEVLPFLETPENMEIFYEVKADLSEHDIAMLAKARVTQIQPGIEALATSTLKLMKKGTTAFQNVNFLKSCSLYNVQPHWNLLMGFPGESEEVYSRYEEIIPVLAHLYPPSGAYPVRFDRFSPYFYQAEAYKLNLQPLDFYSMIYPFNDVDLKNLAYYFGDANLQADYSLCVSKWINRIREKITGWQARWNDSKVPPPRLNFKGDSTIVYDSRFADAVEHDVGKGGKAVLNHLARPVRIEDLAKFCSTIGLDASREVELLHQKKLLFHENDRLLSLVIDGGPAQLLPDYLRSSLPMATAVAGAEVQR